MSSSSRFRPSLLPAALLLGALAPLSGCEILLTRAECEDLDQMCPNLECDDYKQDRDGCSICECVEEQEPVVCFSDSECAEGQACDTVNFCERDPACDGQSDCPAVCYGRCVQAAETCASSADCRDGEVCVPFGNARPAPDGGGGQEADPAPPMQCFADSDCGAGALCVNGACTTSDPPEQTGVCVPEDCAAAPIDLPMCPPGTVAEVDFSSDPCGVPVCVPVDGCRELDAETCRNTPGCEVFFEDCCGGTEPSACDCAPTERCAATDDCGALTPEQCLQNPACALVDVGSTGGGSDGGAPCQTCDPSGNCTPCEGDPIAPPPTEQVCVPRQVNEGCFSDADCLPGELCAVVQSCGTGCEIQADGSEVCFEECWVEAGQCVPSTSTCWDIFDPDVCSSTPGCELIEGAGAAPPAECDPNDPACGGERPIAIVCQPASTSCLADNECPAGQHCELRETCPPCDPSNPDDLGCLAPCFLDGQCVDGVPPPPPCSVDEDCGLGGTCVVVEVCDCVAPDGADCAPECRQAGVCVYENVACYIDEECAAGEFCDFSQGCFTSPNGLIACQGICTALEEPPPPDTAFCLADDGCGEGGFCVTHPDVCRDNPNSDIEACWGWCAFGCGDALTPAQDPATGQCVTFNDTCVPPEWTQAASCAP
jgi:Cys-rich repeat protein